MSSKKVTFSRQIKDELARLPCVNDCCRQAELSAAVFGAGILDRQHQDGLETIVLATAHSASAERLTTLCQDRYGELPDWQAGRELVSLTFSTAEVLRALHDDLQSVFGFSFSKRNNLRLHCQQPCCRHAILRAWFLTCGSVSEPAAGYHLELSMRRPEAARLAVALLAELDIRAGIVSRHGHDVVYIKEGQYIADFLLLSGAHLSLLDFESLRVEKEMRNSVNRMVNCDNANTQRLADTAARQNELIRRLSDAAGLDRLPEDLRATAEIRLKNPDLSIKELGEQMQPPLGKSGMNHRLKRLERLAAELLGTEGGNGDGH